VNRLTPTYDLSKAKAFSQHIFTYQPIRLMATYAVLLVAFGVPTAPGPMKYEGVPCLTRP